MRYQYHEDIKLVLCIYLYTNNKSLYKLQTKKIAIIHFMNSPST